MEGDGCSTSLVTRSRIVEHRCYCRAMDGCCGSTGRLYLDPKFLIGSCRLDFPSLLPGHGQGNRAVPSRSVAGPAPSVFRTVAAPVVVVKASPTDFPSLSATAVGAKTTVTKAKKQASNKGKFECAARQWTWTWS